MQLKEIFLGAALLLGCSLASATEAPFEACFVSASARFGVDRLMLLAIAVTESKLNPNAVGPKNVNGTYDMGIMQINSAWLSTLERYQIGRNDLMGACTNIHVGAWILAQNIQRHGSTWKAVGAYNASTAAKQLNYVSKVQKNYVLVTQNFN
jgi:soluble lytic murein transglycosylase-like protein